MKYEIIKGSEKDFEGAPEWATLRTVGDSGIYFFVEAHAAGMRVVAADGIESTITQHQDIWPEIIAERRPITEPVVNQQLTTEWGEDGLPPVGVECEFSDGCGEWEVGKVIAVGGKEIFWYSIAADDEFLTAISEGSEGFRPIRSPEDVARDEALNAMSDASIELDTDNPLIERIYEAIAAGKIHGITKTPTVSELMRVTENATREDCEAIVKLLSGK